MAEEKSKQEQIGFHKGSLATLSKERQELQRILGIVEQLMHMHISSLKDLGVDVSKEMKETKEKPKKKQKKPIEDLV